MKGISQELKDNYCAKMSELLEARRQIQMDIKQLTVEFKAKLPIKVGDVIKIHPATAAQMRWGNWIPKEGYEKAWVAAVTVFDDGDFAIDVYLPKKDGTPSSRKKRVYGTDFLNNIEIIERNEEASTIVSDI